jgi:hypothetical protein
LSFTNAAREEPHRSGPGWCRRARTAAKLGVLGLLRRRLGQKQRCERPSVERGEFLGLA